MLTLTPNSMLRLTLILLLVTLLLLFCDGCGNPQTVYVQDGVAVRLAEDTTARVYVETSPGVWVKGSNKMTLPEGGYYKRLLIKPPTTKPDQGQSMKRFKLGKRPAQHQPKALRFRDYLDATKLPAPPVAFGHQSLVPDWGMLANDQYGCCVLAGAAHETMMWNREAGRTVAFNDASVLAVYAAITGFDPADPNSDNGIDMIEAAKYRQKIGVLDASNTRHQIAAYLSLRPGNVQELATAAYLFGAVGVGVQMPQSAMEQFDAGHPWSVVSGSSIDGGHYVPLVGRLANGNFLAITWGKVQEVSPRFIEKYCDEAVAYLSKECLTGDCSPEGFDYQQLQKDLAALR